MSEKTNIVWCDSTFNPWIGCTKVSPACDQCYAERDWQDRRHVVTWGTGQPRKRTSAANWKLPLRWNAKTFYECETCGWRGEDGTQSDRLRLCMNCGTGTRLMPTRRRVFCASLADWLDNEVPIEWFVDLLDLIRRCDKLDFLLLTKRIGNWEKRLISARNYVADCLGAEDPEADALFDFIDSWFLGNAPKHVWLGATICNQPEADRDIPKLLSVPAAVRFLSVEPMLGPISMRWLPAWPENALNVALKPNSLTTDHLDGLRRIDWVICGGESGPKARPMHPDWPRQLRDQCAAVDVPFMFKQHGEWLATAFCTDDQACIQHKGLAYITSNGEVRHGIQESVDFFGGEEETARIGVKAAGRLLDGREHNEFPS